MDDIKSLFFKDRPYEHGVSESTSYESERFVTLPGRPGSKRPFEAFPDLRGGMV